MKNLAFISTLSLLILSCSEQNLVGEKIDPKIEKSNAAFLNQTLIFLDQVSEDPSNKNQGLTLGNPLGDTVSLYSELVKLFHPDNFKCKCDGAVRKKIIEYKREGQNVAGFVPDVLLKDAFYSDKAILLKNNVGGNVLANGFYYITSDGVPSKFLFASESPTSKAFNMVDYIETRPDIYSNFIYTYDCSGFLSAALSIAANAGKNSLKSSANAVVDVKSSLTVLGGVMYSPLYQAYAGTGKFSGDSAIVINTRIGVLNAILTAVAFSNIPDQTKIHINTNYRVILSSNAGNSSFNGKGELGINAGANFGVASINGQAELKASLDRKTNFSAYNTYVVDGNVNAEPLEVTVTEIKSKITSLEAILKKIPS